MKTSDLIKALVHILSTQGDLEVDISVAKQTPEPKQGYLLADARFIDVAEHDKEPNRVSIRDWPY